jgi:hypothetical protein
VTAPTAPDAVAADSIVEPDARSRGFVRALRSRRTRWLVGVVLVFALVVVAILVVLGSVARRQADDPRSSIGAAAGALAALLTDQGVRVVTTDRVADAAGRLGRDVTLVVANGDRLSAADAGRLLAGGAGRVILLRPNTSTLTAFGARATAVSPATATVTPACSAPDAQRAGTITVRDVQATYRAEGPAEVSCYPTAGGGRLWLRVPTAAGPSVDLVAGGISNAALGSDGNAALAMGVFGDRPGVVWLMARSQTPTDGDADPTLLPGWWELAVVQAVIGLVAVGIWRGRRLGPILSERLPVTVRAAETVEGHGRLYYRLRARDRAAERLRAGARQRLSRVLGHAEDPAALSGSVAARTGQEAGVVHQLLFGPAPDTDDHLVGLARDLDRLEQEARRL